ncbi:MAG: response regulator [Syntrophobacteraceae bacterium]
MTGGLPVIIVDDDPAVCELTAELVRSFYTWGRVFVFTDPDEALRFCQSRQTGVAIFILDVFLGKKTCFSFLKSVQPTFPFAPQDTIIMTGNANDEVVDMCIASDITYLLEKPIRSYALKLAVRAIAAKYAKFAKKLLLDPVLADHVARI